MEAISIVGIGLIGGSLAKALRKAGFAGRIIGVSRKETIRKALDSGLIDEPASLSQAARKSTVMVLCRPVLNILEDLQVAGRSTRASTLVTDVGSTKKIIAARGRVVMRRGVFIGGHPMAGKEKAGIDAADASLFEGRTWFLTPAQPKDMDHPAAIEFSYWLSKIGAQLTIVDPAEHDRLMALVSHLPQLASTALASAISSRLGFEKARTAAGPGLRDMVRLAESSWPLWADIIATNRVPLSDALDLLVAELSAMRAGLAKPREVERFFMEASNFASTLRQAKN